MQENTPSNSVENLCNTIKEVIQAARNNVYKAANFAMVSAYWHVGELIVKEEQRGERRAEYGGELIKQLSKRLTSEFGKGFTETNLKYMRQFYSTFQNSHALRGELSWTHYRLLLKVEKEEARLFYFEECIDSNWSTRTLERQINSFYFERMLMSGKEGRMSVKKEAEGKKEEMLPKHIIKDPYVLEFLDLQPNKKFYEKELEQGLIDKLQEFLLELGKGFSFVRRQYRISAEDDHFYVDLVFYNYILKCFLLVDLKAGKLNHQDIGQMDLYVRYFEDQVRQENDNPTIGLILCAEKNNTVVKYSLLHESKQIFASKYQIYLPTEEELQNELERERKELEMEKRMSK
jgi:predicted nuclease of restriction endonuclease-like (RecB) superfamily